MIDFDLLLKITLDDVDTPTVWRELLFPAGASFHDLNRAIQYSMEWNDIDTYAFEVEKDGKIAHVTKLSDDPDFDYSDLWLGETLNAEAIAVGEYLKKEGEIIRYIFGDEKWYHHVEVIGVPRTSNYTIACIDGRGACPPSIIIASPEDYRAIKRMFGLPCNSSFVESTLYGTEGYRDYHIPMETIRNYLELRDGEVFDPTRLSMREIDKRFEIWLTTARPKLLNSDENIIYDPYSCQWWTGYWTNPIDEAEN